MVMMTTSKESSLMQFLGISQLKMVLILEKCGCLDKETNLVDKQRLEQLGTKEGNIVK
jgi:hypothetical protein